MWAVHVSLLMKMFSLTASLSQKVVSTLDLGLGSDASFSHTLGLAYNCYLDAPHNVQVLFASRTLQEWSPTFIANVMCDGISIFMRGPLPALPRRERGDRRIPVGHK